MVAANWVQTTYRSWLPGLGLATMNSLSSPELVSTVWADPMRAPVVGLSSWTMSPLAMLTQKSRPSLV